ncbi:hypothetical protein L3X38_006262 [Prunus dulcis]|uniref:Uncharacterized protein n=1 Tax=Prunus dulcis TaxID=3755 RepID=A0AAD4ZSJ2_PRUDU|nr:hypothetical protein L3X38_006262 [Prunus dulcis]
MSPVARPPGFPQLEDGSSAEMMSAQETTPGHWSSREVLLRAMVLKPSPARTCMVVVLCFGAEKVVFPSFSKCFNFELPR